MACKNACVTLFKIFHNVETVFIILEHFSLIQKVALWWCKHPRSKKYCTLQCRPVKKMRGEHPEWGTRQSNLVCVHLKKHCCVVWEQRLRYESVCYAYMWHQGRILTIAKPRLPRIGLDGHYLNTESHLDFFLNVMYLHKCNYLQTISHGNMLKICKNCDY